MKTGPILLVDDDADDWEFTKEALALSNIPNELKCFANGREALAYLQGTTEQPFLILSDVNMPLMSGPELRQTIYADDRLRQKNIPFVFLSTSGGSPAVRNAAQTSIQGFFEKPTDLQGLAHLLKEICSYWGRCRH